ncbi:MAG: hypothetical protein JNL94_06735 [Planctomycetes bacterium]|nr:hypothetical protein [Planctomycetota bacterium]
MGTPSESSSSPHGAACAVGFALALVTHGLPAAVLEPAVDRFTAQCVALSCIGVLLSIGASIVAGRGSRELGRRTLLGGTIVALVASCVGALLLDDWRALAARGLRGEWPIPYYPWIAAVVVGAAAPTALPLGALLAVVVGDGRRPPLAALLASLGVGWITAPWILDDALGVLHAMQIVAVLVGWAGASLVGRGPVAVGPTRLGAGATIAAIALGAIVLVEARAWTSSVDRGNLPQAVFLGVAALAAAAIQRFVRSTSSSPSRVVLIVAAACAATCMFPVEPFVLRDGAVLDAASIGWPLAAAALCGAAFGALLRVRGDGSAIHALPFQLVGLAPIVAWGLSPQIGARGLALVAAAAVLVVVARARPFPVVAAAALTVVAIASVAGLGPSSPADAVRAERCFRGADGVAYEVRDEASRRSLIAIDGRSPFGRSTDQERRFAHLPLLLHGSAERVLVIGTAATITARAASEHGSRTLHWLRPYDEFEVPRPHGWTGSDPPTTGGERQFLAIDRGPYDVVVAVPDPRVGRRMATTGTVEAFALARSRLATGGTWCQWYDLADVDVDDLVPVVAAALTVFPYVYVVADHPRTRRAGVGLLLRDEPLIVDPARIERMLAERPSVAADYARIGSDALDVACMVLAERGVLEVFAPQELALTDARPFGAIRRALRGRAVDRRIVDGVEFLQRCASDPTPWIAATALGSPQARAELRARFEAARIFRAGALAVVGAQGAFGVPFDLELDAEIPALERDAVERARAWIATGRDAAAR